MALDFQDAAAALAMVDRLGEEVAWYKVGMELFYAEGGRLLDAIRGRGKRVFLDLKLHDIPNTMAMALRSLSRLPVELCTLHIPAGPEALRACDAEARRIADSGGPSIGLLGVTRLTSLLAARCLGPMAGRDLAGGPGGGLRNLRLDRARRGCTLVARRSRSRPRVGLPGDPAPGTGESRTRSPVGTPEAAVRGGADWIVVGRPITRAEDPPGAAREIVRRVG